MFLFINKYIYLLFFLFQINKLRPDHFVELYNYNNYYNFSYFANFSGLSLLLNIGMNDIIKIYKSISKNEKDFLSRVAVLKNLYKEFLIIKNSSISFTDKVQNIFYLIENNIDNIVDKMVILKVYKKILCTFL